jgi:hypothetical protein
MTDKYDLEHGALLAALHYDPMTGVFTWKVRAGRARAGDVAGYLDYLGYRTIRLRGGLHAAHRLAWFYVHGEWPPSGIDHKNGQPDDNRIENLRPATQSLNNANAKRRRDNTSGFKGVSRHQDGKWLAQIQAAGRNRYIGLFASPEDAHAAYMSAAKEVFGEFANSGVRG